jgi:hypothetical protein
MSNADFFVKKEQTFVQQLSLSQATKAADREVFRRET